jgi:hypothetical protein
VARASGKEATGMSSPFVLWNAIAETFAWSRRHKALRASVRETIEAEGGQVEGITIIGMLLRSPFPPINLRPIYLKATCRYPGDRGAWYICGTDAGDVHWVWSSDSKSTQPPVANSRPMQVNNSVWALPRWLSVLLYILFIVGLIGLLVGLIHYS